MRDQRTQEQVRPTGKNSDTRWGQQMVLLKTDLVLYQLEFSSFNFIGLQLIYNAVLVSDRALTPSLQKMKCMDTVFRMTVRIIELKV